MNHDLVAFRDVYVTYLNETLGSEAPVPQSKRSEVARRAQSAQVALDRLGHPFVWLPPPITQTGPMHGLLNTIFVHETPFGGFSSGMFGEWPKSYEGILTVVDAALADVERLYREAKHKRRSPIYWADKIITVMLGFPAYLLGKIFRVPFGRIDESPFGTALRIATFLIECTVVVLAIKGT